LVLVVSKPADSSALASLPKAMSSTSIGLGRGGEALNGEAAGGALDRYVFDGDSSRAVQAHDDAAEGIGLVRPGVGQRRAELAAVARSDQTGGICWVIRAVAMRGAVGAHGHQDHEGAGCARDMPHGSALYPALALAWGADAHPTAVDPQSFVRRLTVQAVLDSLLWPDCALTLIGPMSMPAP
jgi:hypothetical protein